MPESNPRLVITINHWTFWGHPSPDAEWSLDQRLDAVKAAGFDAFCAAADEPALAEALAARGLLFGGAFDAGSEEQFEPQIRAILEIGDGPINCQLGDHDTPVDRATELTIALMAEAEKQNAAVHLEMHRDTCTETPEKTYAIVEGVRKATGKDPRVNFDFSHPAIIKHLDASNYAERLFEDLALFQKSTLWHMRPFNGHHCMVPVTDGNGSFSPEYEEMRPFIRTALQHWLAGPRPNNELWVMPELGPKPGYGLSCFPKSWDDAIVLGKDIQSIWTELVPSETALKSTG